VFGEVGTNRLSLALSWIQPTDPKPILRVLKTTSAAAGAEEVAMKMPVQSVPRRGRGTFHLRLKQ